MVRKKRNKRTAKIERMKRSIIQHYIASEGISKCWDGGGEGRAVPVSTYKAYSKKSKLLLKS